MEAFGFGKPHFGINMLFGVSGRYAIRGEEQQFIRVLVRMENVISGALNVRLMMLMTPARLWAKVSRELEDVLRMALIGVFV